MFNDHPPSPTFVLDPLPFFDSDDDSDDSAIYSDDLPPPDEATIHGSQPDQLDPASPIASPSFCAPSTPLAPLAIVYGNTSDSCQPSSTFDPDLFPFAAADEIGSDSHPTSPAALPLSGLDLTPYENPPEPTHEVSGQCPSVR